jgi:inhibitor of KinA
LNCSASKSQNAVFVSTISRNAILKTAPARVAPHLLYNSREMQTAQSDSVQFQPASDQSLLIYFGQQITPDAHERIRKLLRLLDQKPIAGVRNLNPAYCSILVSFDALRLNHADLEEILRGYIHHLEALRIPKRRELKIPTCYGGEFGPDLNEVASLHG